MLTRRSLMEAASVAVVSAFVGAPPSSAGPLNPAKADTGALDALLHARASDGTNAGGAGDGGKPAFCFFSKHLGDLSVPDLASAVIDMGYDGIDLTVRPGGHVLPERVTADLPKALDTIRAKGSSVRMITTGLVSASDPTARPILQAAAKAGITLVKPGYWKYSLKDVRGEVASMARDVTGLAALAKEYGVTIGLHNHTGNIGSALWDLAPHIDTLDAKAIGYYFDPRHAMVEGGGVGWKAATLLVAPRMKMIAVKDFYWEKQGATWKIKNCPIGEGMLEWPWFAEAVVKSGFGGPISVHFEYDIPGATPDEQHRNTYAAGRRDLAFIRKQFAEVKA